MRAEGPAERFTGRLLATLTVAFAAWTAAYHVAVVADLSTGVAGAGAVALLAVAGMVALALTREEEPQPARVRAVRGPPRVEPLDAALAAAALAAAVAGAALYAFTDVGWAVCWALLALACAAAVVLTLRTTGVDADDGHARETWPELLVVGAWAVVCGVLALLVVNPSGDDAHYAHLAAWVAANGRFPVRDVMLSPDVLPALYFPPVPSYEPLVGAAGRLTGIATPDLFYYALPPVAAVLAVLAGWRMLRRWRVPLPAVALTVAILFLFFHSGERRHLGEYFIGRLWQGKTLFVWIGVPVLWTLLADYARRPGRPAPLLLLGCAGAAGVGLTTTAIFVVPVLAAGALAPLALRAPRQALLGVFAAAAYPLGAGLVTLKLGGRTPDEFLLEEVQPRYLLSLVLGDGLPAFLALVALAGAAVVLPRGRVAPMVACSALLVVALLAPRVPQLVYDVTGLGRVLWRLLWVVPVALALGALAASAARRATPWPLRLLPAVALGAAAVIGGSPTWEVMNARIAGGLEWKRPARVLAQARAVLPLTQPGDLVLTPPNVTQTLLVIRGDLYAVNPREFFIRPLRDDPRADYYQRLFLLRLVTGLLRPPVDDAQLERRVAYTRRSLDRLGVDLACAPKVARRALTILRAAGYGEVGGSPRLTCLRPRRPS